MKCPKCASAPYREILGIRITYPMLFALLTTFLSVIMARLMGLPLYTPFGDRTHWIANFCHAMIQPAFSIVFLYWVMSAWMHGAHAEKGRAKTLLALWPKILGAFLAFNVGLWLIYRFS